MSLQRITEKKQRKWSTQFEWVTSSAARSVKGEGVGQTGVGQSMGATYLPQPTITIALYNRHREGGRGEKEEEREID